MLKNNIKMLNNWIEYYYDIYTLLYSVRLIKKKRNTYN